MIEDGYAGSGNVHYHNQLITGIKALVDRKRSGVYHTKHSYLK